MSLIFLLRFFLSLQQLTGAEAPAGDDGRRRRRGVGVDGFPGPGAGGVGRQGDADLFRDEWRKRKEKEREKDEFFFEGKENLEKGKKNQNILSSHRRKSSRSLRSKTRQRNPRTRSERPGCPRRPSPRRNLLRRCCLWQRGSRCFFFGFPFFFRRWVVVLCVLLLRLFVSSLSSDTTSLTGAWSSCAGAWSGGPPRGLLWEFSLLRERERRKSESFGAEVE